MVHLCSWICQFLVSARILSFFFVSTNQKDSFLSSRPIKIQLFFIFHLNPKIKIQKTHADVMDTSFLSILRKISNKSSSFHVVRKSLNDIISILTTTPSLPTSEQNCEMIWGMLAAPLLQSTDIDIQKLVIHALKLCGKRHVVRFLHWFFQRLHHMIGQTSSSPSSPQTLYLSFLPHFLNQELIIHDETTTMIHDLSFVRVQLYTLLEIHVEVASLEYLVNSLRVLGSHHGVPLSDGFVRIADILLGWGMHGEVTLSTRTAIVDFLWESTVGWQDHAVYSMRVLNLFLPDITKLATLKDTGDFDKMNCVTGCFLSVCRNFPSICIPTEFQASEGVDTSLVGRVLQALVSSSNDTIVCLWKSNVFRLLKVIDHFVKMHPRRCTTLVLPLFTFYVQQITRKDVRYLGKEMEECIHHLCDIVHHFSSFSKRIVHDMMKMVLKNTHLYLCLKMQKKTFQAKFIHLINDLWYMSTVYQVRSMI